MLSDNTARIVHPHLTSAVNLAIAGADDSLIVADVMHLTVVSILLLYDGCIIPMQEADLNQTSADKKPNAGNVSPATLANGNKQSNGYESPRIGRRFAAILNCNLCALWFRNVRPLCYVLKMTPSIQSIRHGLIFVSFLENFLPVY